MPLLNSFVDSFICAGFSSELGLTLDPESKDDGSIFTSYLQASILAIVTSDRATYPTSRDNESIDPSYPSIRRLSSSSVQSFSSGRSTPSSLLNSGTRTPKQPMIPIAYKDLPLYCFPDGIRATYEREKEKIHHFVLTQGGKRQYALVLTFQQSFTLKTNKPDDDGVYHIKDVKSSTQHTRPAIVSKIPVAIDKQKPISPSTTPTPSPTATPVKARSKKMPSSFHNADANKLNKTRSGSSQDLTKQPPPTSRHYEVQTISSYKKNLSSTAAPPPSRIARARSQDNLKPSNTTSTTSSSGMRNRMGSIVVKPVPMSTASSLASSATSSATSSTTSSTTSTSTSVDIKPFYLPHCVVLISNEPYWIAMQETISIIYNEITRSHIQPCSREYKKLIQKYAFLACNTPTPPVPWERFSLSFNVANDQFVITLDPPINASRSVLDLDLSILLLTLSIGKLLDVLAAIFTEQPIIFFSSNYSTLVTTLECLLYLIYPLKWTNIYIPLVPDGLRDVYLEGPPGLYIKGAHSRHQTIVEQLNISLTCNLDNDKNIHVPRNIEFHHIPPTKMHRFIDPITQLLEEIRVARALRHVPTVARLPMDQQRELKRRQRFETNQKITNIFLTLMIDLCGDALEPIYWKVTCQQISPPNTLAKTSTNERKTFNLPQTTAKIPVFSKEKYLLPKTEGIELEFYRAFVETTAFLNLIKEEMISTSSTGFRQICQIYFSSTEDQLYGFTSTTLDDLDNNQLEPTTTLGDPLSSQMLLPLPDWSSDMSTHYLDNCIDVFTNELENAQQERSPAVLAVYAYLRGCAQLARGEYIEGLRDLYLIENSNLFPQKYIETVIVPRLADEGLLDRFLNEPFYTKCPEWQKVRIRSISQSMSIIDLNGNENFVHAAPIPSSSDVITNEWNIIEDMVTYEQFSDHVHRLNIVLDQEITETLFKALLYWTDNSTTKTLKKDRTSTNKSLESMKSPNKSGSAVSTFTFQDTLNTVNDSRRGNSTPTLTPTPRPSKQPMATLPTLLFESFLDIWQETNAEKIRMNRYLPEDRQKQESILKFSSSGIVSKKDGPGQIVLTQKRLYFLAETRSSFRLLTELLNIVFVEQYQHQTVFSSSKPAIKIYTSSTSSLPRDNNIVLKLKPSAFDKQSKSSSISLFFKTNQEQDLWYTIIVELWSGLTIAHERFDTAVLNTASRNVALMDTLSNIDYDEETMLVNDQQLPSLRQKSKQHHNEECLKMALKDLSTFTRMRQLSIFKPLSDETRKVLTRRLSPAINEIERHPVRCLIFTEHPDTGRSSLWCAYGSKLKVFNVTSWICDPKDLCFPSLITSMCLDARYKLWVRCAGGQLFVVDTLTHMCDAELETNDDDNGCQSIVYDIRRNHILTANRMGIITLWNASNWKRLYDINVLEIYRTTHNIQEKTFKSQVKMTLRTTTEPSNLRKIPNRNAIFFGGPKESINPLDIPNLPASVEPAEIIPSSNDKLERIQIYEDLLFACYRDDYIIILRITNSNEYIYEHLISVKYKTGDSILIDSFLVYNKQLWVSTGCIISIFNVLNTYDENSYNLLMKKPVDDDNLVTMLGLSGFIWAGSFNGNVYVFHMDNYELHKTFAGHRDSVWCLCPMLDRYVVSGSAQKDRSIIVWDNVETSNSGNTKTSNNGNTKGDFIKPIDIL